MPGGGRGIDSRSGVPVRIGDRALGDSAGAGEAGRGRARLAVVGAAPKGRNLAVTEGRSVLLTSHGTGGRRRRLRVHCGGDRALVYRGRVSGEHAFEVDSTDGRTYRLSLTAAAAVAAAGATGPIRRVAALFVHPRGPYAGRADVDAWPVDRDARRYSGPWPVVAHPPCARWSAYTFFARGGAKQHRQIGDDGGCFEAALRVVRTWGGVIEHPRYSRAWPAFGIQRPARGGGWQRLACGGWTCEVWQGRFGGRVPKPTWLYFYSPSGHAPASLDWAVAVERRAAFSTFHRNDLRRSRRSGLPLMSTQQRSRTPDRFRDVLIAMARGAVGDDADQGARRANGAIPPARGLGAARLVSWGTGGRRRRLRVHCGASRELVYCDGGDADIEVDATDGRTYRLRLSRDDWDVLTAAAATSG